MIRFHLEKNERTLQGQRPRIVDSQERAQRALIGTIEASIRAVEAAEEEMKKPVEIQIPRFNDDPASRRWIETKVEVEKQKVTVCLSFLIFFQDLSFLLFSNIPFSNFL